MYQMYILWTPNIASIKVNWLWLKEEWEGDLDPEYLVFNLVMGEQSRTFLGPLAASEI